MKITKQAVLCTIQWNIRLIINVQIFVNELYQNIQVDFDVQTTAATTNSLYQTLVPTGDPLGNTVIYTRSPAETENYLDSHGIDLCKNPIIQRRTNEQEVEQEQRICVRYLQPPPLPRPGVMK